jgi:hypothetical protein
MNDGGAKGKTDLTLATALVNRGGGKAVVIQETSNHKQQTIQTRWCGLQRGCAAHQGQAMAGAPETKSKGSLFEEATKGGGRAREDVVFLTQQPQIFPSQRGARAPLEQENAKRGH